MFLLGLLSKTNKTVGFNTVENMLILNTNWGISRFHRVGKNLSFKWERIRSTNFPWEQKKCAFVLSSISREERPDTTFMELKLVNNE